MLQLEKEIYKVGLAGSSTTAAYSEHNIGAQSIPQLPQLLIG